MPHNRRFSRWWRLAPLFVLVLLGPGLVMIQTPSPQPSERAARELTHDFGEVILKSDRGERLTHTFRLKNSSSEDLHILAIEKTCGCTEVHANQDQVPAGESVHVDATLMLSRSGTKSATILVHFTDGSTSRLRMSAIGKRLSQLGTMESGLAIEPHGPSDTVLLYYTSLDEDVQLTDPEVKSPEFIECRFSGWELVQDANPSERKPARWHGVLEVKPVGEFTVSWPRLVLRMPGSNRLTIPVMKVPTTGG